MTSGLNVETRLRREEELLTASARSTDSGPVAIPAVSGTAELTCSVPAARKKMSFAAALPREKTLHLGMYSLADQAVASATNFATGVILARACSKEELGLYALGFSLILLMTDFQTSLITTPYMVYAPRLSGRAHALYTGSTLLHQLAFCLATMFGVACAAAAAGRGLGPRGLGPVLWALSVVIALIMLREHARRVSFARLRLKTAFLFDASIAVGQLAGLALLARLGLLSASRAFWVIGSVCGVAVLGWLWSDRAFYHPRFGESVADLRKNWVFGKWVFASGLVWAVSMNLYPWFLAHFHGTASTGVWAACVGVASVGNPLQLGIQNLVGPKISHVYAASGRKALRILVVKLSAAIALLMLAVCLPLLFWGGRLIALFYGRQYAGNSLVITVLALGMLVSAPAFSFSRALYAIERADLDFLVNFAALFTMVTTGFWLVRAYGPLGAAFGLLAANFATSVVRAAAFLRLKDVEPARSATQSENQKKWRR